MILGEHVATLPRNWHGFGIWERKSSAMFAYYAITNFACALVLQFGIWQPKENRLKSIVRIGA